MSMIFPNPPAGAGFNIANNNLPQSFWVEGGVDSLPNNGCMGVVVNATANVIVGQMLTTNVVTQAKRTLFTVATLNTIVGCSVLNGNPNRNPFLRDPTNGSAAFYFRAIFGCENVGTNPDTWFCGLGTAPANINTITNAPSASISDFFGILKDRTDINWQFARRTLNGVATKIDLGIAPAAGQLWVVEIVSPAAGGALRLKASRMLSISTSTTVIDTTVTTTLPTVTSSLGWFLGGMASGVGDTGVAVISVQGVQNRWTLPTPII